MYCVSLHAGDDVRGNHIWHKKISCDYNNSVIIFRSNLCVLYINVESSRKQLTEINALNEKCIEDQKNYYLNVMKKDEELRAFKHDVTSI